MIYKSSALRRVLGTLANSEDFSRVFKCEPNLKMNPETKCKVWWISIIYLCPCYKRLWQYLTKYVPISIIFIIYDIYIQIIILTLFKIKTFV